VAASLGAELAAAGREEAALAASAAWAAAPVAAAPAEEARGTLVEAARLVVRTQGRLAMAWSLTREPADCPYPIAQGLSAERINRCSK
jgi:hypothetical protein